jgi:hypothetical protein
VNGFTNQLYLPFPDFLILVGGWSVKPCLPKYLGIGPSCNSGGSWSLGTLWGISLALWVRVMVGLVYVVCYT